MSNFTPLYGSILTSTIWAEDAETRLVWITMLAMSDASGYVGASVPGLAHAARVSIEGCRKALDKFLNPDPDSRTSENEGRRIEKVDGGWKLLNYEKHRERASEIRHNVLSAIRMREMRAKRKTQSVKNVPEQREQLQNVSNVPQAWHRHGISHTSCAGVRAIFARVKMDDDGFKTIEEKIKTPAEAMLLVEKSAKAKNGPGWIISHVRNGYEPPAIVPQSSLSNWANELGIISKICGHEFSGRIRHSNSHVILTVGDANHAREVRIPFAELTPEAIEFKE